MPVFDEPPPPTRRVIVVDRPGAVQTEIRVGHVAIPRKHPDYMALNMAMKVLGGEGANRLQRVLRSERGLTYGAQADLETLKQSGDFMAETDTRSETTGDALRVVVEEYWRLRRERVNRGELESAQDYLAGSFPLTIETPSAIALQVLNVLFYGLDLQELETFPQRVRAVTPGDIQRVAEQFLKPDRLSIVLVGDADAFVPQLRGAGFDTFERIPAAELDLTAADLRRKPAARSGGHGSSDVEPPPQPAGLLQAPGADAAARAVIEKAIAALGGLDALRALKSLRATGTTTIMGPQGPMKVETTTTFVYPDRVRVEGELPVGPMVQVYAAGQAWMQDPNGIREAPPAMRDGMGADLARDSKRLLLEAYDGRAQARALPDATSEDGRRQTSIEITPAGLGPVTLRLDPQTGFIESASYGVPGPSGRRSTMEQRLQDYRPVDGVQFPFAAAVRLDGALVQERLLKKVEVNPTIDPGVFTKPAK
jgi:hypothetical protein